jgi:hypothetical protein
MEGIIEFVKGIWDDLVEFGEELPIKALKGMLDAMASVIETMNPPDFMDQPIGNSLGPVMEYIGYFMAQAGINEALALLTAGIMFRLSRKAVTLGRW